MYIVAHILHHFTYFYSILQVRREKIPISAIGGTKNQETDNLFRRNTSYRVSLRNQKILFDFKTIFMCEADIFFNLFLICVNLRLPWRLVRRSFNEAGSSPERRRVICG